MNIITINNCLGSTDGELEFYCVEMKRILPTCIGCCEINNY